MAVAALPGEEAEPVEGGAGGLVRGRDVSPLGWFSRASSALKKELQQRLTVKW